ncbi:MAG TPA: hypothetical protein VHO24_06940 [Opitutaceae bacterium]|nr:hypothetical protein [Opitutaceae bacterium]
MQTETIFATLLAAAAFLKKPVQDLATASLQAAYDSAKTHLRKIFGEGSEATNALDLATAKPESLVRKALLVEESASSGLDKDPVLHGLIERLSSLVPVAAEVNGARVRVSGSGNNVQVAGRDLVIKTEKHFRRSVITPDERHLTDEQREKLRRVIGELAERLAVGDGGPNFAAVHRMIQRRYAIASYLLIPRENFEDALSFLIQRRAIHRSRLRRNNRVAYQNDFFRSIYAGAGELGWDRTQVYKFAFDKLGLTKPLTSLRQLGPVQLKSLADFVRRQVANSRNR